MNTLSGDALSPYGDGGAGGGGGSGSWAGAGGGRGNCNGIIISRGGPVSVGRDGGASSVAERGGPSDVGRGQSEVERARSDVERVRSDVERVRNDVVAGVRFTDNGCGRGRPGSEGGISGTDRGSGSYVSVAVSSAPSAAASGSADSRGSARASNGSDLSRGGAAVPARRDPQSRPGEYLGGPGNSRGSADGTLRAQPASRDTAEITHDAKPRVADSDCDTGLGGSLPAETSTSPIHPRYPEHPEDVTSCPKPPGAQQVGGVCETRLAYRAVPHREDLPAEKFQSEAGAGTNPARSAEHVPGQAPPSYQPRYAQHPPPAVAGRDYHSASGLTGRDYHVTSAMVGRDYNSDRIAQHLRVLVSRDDEDDYHQDVVTEWRVVAHIMDRLLFWLFLLVAIVSSVLILIVKPLTKPEKWRHEG